MEGQKWRKTNPAASGTLPLKEEEEEEMDFVCGFYVVLCFV